MLKASCRPVNAWLAACIRYEDKYEGLVVKSLDGSSVQPNETFEDQKAYPQLSSQRPGCSFAVLGDDGNSPRCSRRLEGFRLRPADRSRRARPPSFFDQLFGTSFDMQRSGFLDLRVDRRPVATRGAQSDEAAPITAPCAGFPSGRIQQRGT